MNDEYLAKLKACKRQQEHEREMAELCGLYGDASFHEGCAHGLEIAAELMGAPTLTDRDLLLIETALEVYTGDGCPEDEEAKQELLAVVVKLRRARQGEG